MSDYHRPYACDSCMLTVGSIKDLIKHYKEKHPNLIERVTIPI
ncbi:MAG: hypothetical protein AB1351_07600 [Thermoproteota archaeon]